MEELLKPDTEALKDAAQKLWQNMCAPTCDGSLIPVDVYQALKDAAASGIEFIIGISSHKTRVFKSLVGNQKYKDMIEDRITAIKGLLDLAYS